MRTLASGRELPVLGARMLGWLGEDGAGPFGSFGSGGAARASAAGLAADDCGDASLTAETLCSLTHDHEEGIRGARALAVAICMARDGKPARRIREKITGEFYPLNFRISDLPAGYRFDATCGGTVPLAIECFLESTSYEEAVRSAASLGGDSPTVASMAGAIAGACFSVPENLRVRAMGMLDGDLRAIALSWERFAPRRDGAYRELTDIGPRLAACASSHGRWERDDSGYGTVEHPYRVCNETWDSLVSHFVSAVYFFDYCHPEYGLNDYDGVLKRKGASTKRAKDRPDPACLDAHTAVAYIMFVVRKDRFCEGQLAVIMEDGIITEWLLRLEDIDAGA
jgi:hypothetical protein